MLLADFVENMAWNRTTRNSKLADNVSMPRELLRDAHAQLVSGAKRAALGGMSLTQLNLKSLSGLTNNIVIKCLTSSLMQVNLFGRKELEIFLEAIIVCSSKSCFVCRTLESSRRQSFHMSLGAKGKKRPASASTPFMSTQQPSCLNVFANCSISNWSTMELSGRAVSTWSLRGRNGVKVDFILYIGMVGESVSGTKNEQRMRNARA